MFYLYVTLHFDIVVQTVPKVDWVRRTHRCREWTQIPTSTTDIRQIPKASITKPTCWPRWVSAKHYIHSKVLAPPAPNRHLFSSAFSLILATSEGSIPMAQDEELHLIEEDQGDGWTRVRRMHGEFEEGFVPTSYIETTLFNK